MTTPQADRLIRRRYIAIPTARSRTAINATRQRSSMQRIADELVIGRETATSNATSIYRKLRVSSRAEAVAHARRGALLPD